MIRLAFVLLLAFPLPRPARAHAATTVHDALAAAGVPASAVGVVVAPAQGRAAPDLGARRRADEPRFGDEAHHQLRGARPAGSRLHVPHRRAPRRRARGRRAEGQPRVPRRRRSQAHLRAPLAARPRASRPRPAGDPGRRDRRSRLLRARALRCRANSTTSRAALQRGPRRAAGELPGAVDFRFIPGPEGAQVIGEPDLPNVEIASHIRSVEGACGAWRHDLHYDIDENGLVAMAVFSGSYPARVRRASTWPLSVFDGPRSSSRSSAGSGGRRAARSAEACAAGPRPPAPGRSCATSPSRSRTSCAT